VIRVCRLTGWRDSGSRPDGSLPQALRTDQHKKPAADIGVPASLLIKLTNKRSLPNL